LAEDTHAMGHLYERYYDIFGWAKAHEDLLKIHLSLAERGGVRGLQPRL